MMLTALDLKPQLFTIGCSNRLGLAEADDVLKTELQLQKAIPKKDWLDMHHRIIFHGRRVCKAQRPLCTECTLRELCKTERERQKTK